MTQPPNRREETSPTSPTAQCWPNLFFVGAPKAATTYVSEVLMLHPKVFSSRIKSPNFMNVDAEMPDVPLGDKLNAYSHIHAALVRDEKLYLNLYRGAEGFPVRADCSVDYLRSAVSAERIAARVLDAKIFALLRNPIERCLSHYMMDLRIGRPVGTFDEEIERHLSLIGRSEFWGENYISTGSYDDQLKRYFACFSPDNILVGIQDDLEVDAAALIARIFYFVGLDPIPLPSNKLSNAAQIPQLKYFNRWLYKTGLKRQITLHVPWAIKELSKKYFYTSRVPHVISDTQYARLAEIFHDHVVELSKMLDRDLMPWLSRRKAAPKS